MSFFLKRNRGKFQSSKIKRFRRFFFFARFRIKNILDTRNLFYFIFLVLRDEGGDLTKDRCTLTFRGKNHIPP